MSWPIPVFLKIEYPKPISLRVWLPTLVAIASCAVTAVVLIWPHGKPTNTSQFWIALIGAPLVACAVSFGVRWCSWRSAQTSAEVDEGDQDRLRGLWRDWTRRHLRIVDVAAFPGATNEIAKFSAEKIDLPTKSKRTISFDWAKGRTAAFRRTRLLRLVAVRFGEALRDRREVFVTLMLDDISPKQTEAWTQQVMRTFGSVIPDLHVEVQSAIGGAEWITQLADRIDRATRLVIAAQLWANEEGLHTFSEGAAAFLIEPGARTAGLIFRPMVSESDELQIALEQIEEYQMSSERFERVWVAGSDAAESTAIRSTLTPDATDMPAECPLDVPLGNAGPASGWIALAIAMEAMRGAGPQLVAWREPEPESLYLCTVLPAPQKETTV